MPAAHVLHSSEVEKLSRDPLLRSADALDALFARSAVVCEADSDRAFYEEINRRLLDTDGRTGALDPVFLNAQNWQTTLSLAKPLRQAVFRQRSCLTSTPWPRMTSGPTWLQWESLRMRTGIES